MLNFNDESELQSWLTAHSINTTLWGMGNAKSICDLWLEVTKGESLLDDDPPMRLATVIQVNVQRIDSVCNTWTLLEAMQEFDDGRTRQRNQSPSEKMLPHEDPLSAAHRCLREELQVDPQQVTLDTDSLCKETFQIDSPSYPGLQTRFIFYTINAKVAGLPDEPFAVKNLAHGQGDPVVVSHWKWSKI
ncbi:hypothetical protein KFU94_45645 [Chloroflexi bacterium TSY]|nr:hypothetical protein [Chloroflexi bacterium TSY]